MKLAIIGGSLLSNLTQLRDVSEENIKTPFGEPSDSFLTGKIEGKDVIYLNRHGRPAVNEAHHIAPHQINYRANLFALKLLEVTHIVAIAAVGGITKKMSPMTYVIPDQLIDYSYGRMQTYNDGNKDEVKHIDFTYPFDDAMGKKLLLACETTDVKCVKRATYGVTQGPRLETIAEIKKMKRDGCDIVGMTAMPEAGLARELNIDYANLSLVVNWAAGVEKGKESGTISMDEIKQRIADGNQQIEEIVQKFVIAL
jgi:5'-methylthioadenosine phosphorylase/5'-methylthioinosine phosphorylase